MRAGASAAVEAAAAALHKHFEPEAARGFSGTFVLELTGASGGVLTLSFEDGALTLAPGAAARRTASIRMGAGELLDLLAGRANGELLYMAGHVEIEGEPRHVVKLQALFRRRV